VAFSATEGAIRVKLRLCIFFTLRGNLVLGSGFTTGCLDMTITMPANRVAGKLFFQTEPLPDFMPIR
jgi:hypothetical protein